MSRLLKGFISPLRNKAARKWSFLAVTVAFLVMSCFFSGSGSVLASTSLFSDNFEANDAFANWTSHDANWVYSADGAGGSLFKAHLTGDTGGLDSILLKNYDTSDYQNVVLSYVYKLGSLEATDHVYAEYTANGTDWTILADYTNYGGTSEFVSASFSLPADAADNADFGFRFRGVTNAAGDHLYIDNIVLSGMQIASASNSSVTVSGDYIPTQGGIATISVTVLDENGSPIVGVLPSDVVISATGSGNSITQPVSATNASGQTSGMIQSSGIGEKVITVTVGGVVLDAHPTITFYGVPSDATIVASDTTVEASLTGTTVDLTISITDGAGNPIPDGVAVNLITTPSAPGTVTVTGAGLTSGGQVTKQLTFNNKGTVSIVANVYSGNLDTAGDIVITFEDTTAPEITLTGSSPVTVEYLGVYSDLGATATDNIDGDITASIVRVNPVATNVIMFDPANPGQIVATYTVTYDVADSAGNHADQVTRTVNVIDTTAPIITSITSDATAAGVLKIGDTIDFTLTPAVTESAASTAVSAAYNGQALTFTTADGGVTYTATYTVTAGETDQVAPLQLTGVTMTDGAGNTSAPFDGSDILKTIDANVPVISFLSFPAYINLANQASIDLSIIGEIGATVNYTINDEDGSTAALTGTGTVGLDGTFAVNRDLTGLTDGDINVSVTLTDAAGNVSVPSTQVSIKDTELPDAPTVDVPTYINSGNCENLTISVTSNEPTKTEGATIYYSFTDYLGVMVSESALVNTDTDADGDNDSLVTNVDVCGLNDSATDGDVAVSATVVDAAGNEGPAGSDTATKETIKPLLTGLDSDGDRYKAGDYTITATFSEDVTDPQIAVDYSGVNGTCDNIAATDMDATADPTIFTYELTIDDDCDGAIGAVTISSATDVAGNIIDADSTHTFIADTLAATFSDTAPATDAFIKADFTVSYTLDEDLASGVITFNSPVTGTYNLSGTELTAGAHTISQASLAGAGIALTEGTHSVSFDGTDLAGNVSPTLTNTNITYDVTPSMVINVTSSEDDGAYTIGRVIPISIEFDEIVAVTGAPQIQLNIGGAERYALFAGTSDPDPAASEPLPTLENKTQATDSVTDESAVDVAERSNVVYRVYVRDGNVYYSSSVGAEELVGAGSDPSIAVGPNGVPQIAYTSGGNVMFAIRAGAWSSSVVAAGSDADIDVDGDNKAHIAYTNADQYVDIMYANNTSGTFVPELVYDGFYWYDNGNKTGRYYSNPIIRVDGNGKYHIVCNHHALDGAIGWTDHSYAALYKTNAGAGFESSGADGTLSKNSLTLDSGNNPHVAYNSGGVLYANPLTAAWTTTALGAGSYPSIAYGDGEIGISYNDGGLKLVRDSGAGFSAPELVDADGNSQSLAMGDYIYAYYLKPGAVNPAQEIWFATNRPLASGAGSTLDFNYTVGANDHSSDLDYTATDSLQLNGGAIRDLAGNDALLTLAFPGEANSLSANKDIVIDALAPEIAVHEEVVAEATSIEGAIVEYVLPIAIDARDGEVAVTCATTSGALFALLDDNGDPNSGDTTVTCTAVDALGNTATSNFNVHVHDTTAPEATAPADINQDANAACSTVDLGLPIVSDVVDANPNVTNDAPGCFDIGITPVIWTVTDFSGNATTVTQNVTINPAPIAKLGLTADSPVDTDETSNITVTGYDAWDHIVTNQSGTLVAVSADNGGALGATILTLTNGVAQTTLTKTIAGNVNVTVTSGILTPATVVVVFNPADVTPPTVTEMSPANGASGVAVSAPLFLIFSEPLDSNTVNSDNIKLMKVGNVELEEVDSQVPAVVSLVEGGRRVSIDPAGLLEYAPASYYFIVSGVADENDNVMTENISADNSGFTTAENTADLTAPWIVAQSPLSETVGVVLDAKPYVDFSEAMKISTLTGDNIQLRKVSDNSVIAASISVENGGTRAVINPTVALDLNTAYYISVTSSVTDEADNAMGGDYTSGNFTTLEDSTVLGVSGIVTNRSSAIDDNTWANGWKWTFNVTVPLIENILRMKFDNFVSGLNTIGAAGNVRYYSAQSSNVNSAENAVVISEAGVYPETGMMLVDDLDGDQLGRQIQIVVETKVPEGSAGGSYSAGYGLFTEIEND